MRESRGLIARFRVTLEGPRMAVPIDARCPSCGAPLPPPIAGMSTCGYCERAVTIQSAVSQPPNTEAALSRRPSRRRVLTILSLILIVMMLPVGYSMIAASVTANRALAEAERVVRKASVTAAGDTRALWDDMGGPPVPVLIDGHEAVLGRLRTVTTGDQLFIVASDSATLKKCWQSAPYGTYSEGYLSTHFVIIGNQVIVSDFHSKLHFLDLRTGQEMATMALSDRVECMGVEKGRVLARQVDNKSLLIDPSNRATTAISGRVSRFDDPVCKNKSVERKARPSSVAPSVDGFSTYRVLIEGEEGIAAGNKSPGTPVPHVVGFDPKTKRVLWRQVLPSVDPNTVQGSSDLAGDLAGHRYFGVYPVGSEIHRLTAFDARNGARLWDVKLRPIFAVDDIEDIIATEQFVYAVRTGSLDVVDAKSGRLIGAIGASTYDDAE